MPKYKHLGGTFWSSDSGVFCEWTPLNLEVATAQVFFGIWASDGKRVFYGPWRSKKIDASSFEALNDCYGRDATACYFGTSVVKGADPKSFAVLDSGVEKLMHGLCRNHEAGFARDDNRVYFNGNLVRKAQPDGFVSLGNCYGRDKNAVFYERFCLNGADPHRWRYLGGYYSRDDNRVFYKNRAVKKTNCELFEHLDPVDSEFAYDGQTIYYRGEPTTPDYYAECLRADVGFLTNLASMVESGAWQRSKFKEEWHYREPDEVLAAYDRVDLGDGLAELTKVLGEGEQVPGLHGPFYFPPIDQMIRPGFSKGAGSVSWSMSDSNASPDVQLRLWRHPEKVLVCAITQGVVAALVILESEYATPPS